jgi:ABC-type spermidine/putrescine transport system permease subunit I
MMPAPANGAAFWEVTLPLCRRASGREAVLVFLLSVGVFLEPKVLGGGKSPMSAELIRQTFETRVNWPLGAALTIVLMVDGRLLHPVVQPALRLLTRGDRAMKTRASEPADRRDPLWLGRGGAGVLLHSDLHLDRFLVPAGTIPRPAVRGFSLDWYGALFRNAAPANALWNSTLIAFVAMIFSTILGTAAAIVAVRYRFRGKIAFLGLSTARRSPFHNY